MNSKTGMSFTKMQKSTKSNKYKDLMHRSFKCGDELNKNTLL